MNEFASLFSVGSRVAFDNALASFAHDWEYGTVVEVKNEGLGFSYRLWWDDGFEDHGWYSQNEITTEAEAKAFVEA